MQGSRISHLPCSSRVGRTGGRRPQRSPAPPRGAPNLPGEHPPAAPRRPLKKPIGDTAPLNNDFVFTYPVARPGPPPGHLTYPPAATQHLPRHAGLEGHSAKINPPVFARFDSRHPGYPAGRLPCTRSPPSTDADQDRAGGGRPSRTSPDPGYPTHPRRRTKKRKTSGAQPCNRSDASPPVVREDPYTPPALGGLLALGKSRRRTAYPQQIVTTRLLYCLQDRFAQLSRLQRI